jgi:hypothetical protein
MLKMNGGEPPGSWPDSPSKPNTNPEPHDETVRPVGLKGDALVRQELVQDTQKPSKGKDTLKKLKVAMLPPEIIER